MNSRMSPALAKALSLEAKYKKPVSIPEVSRMTLTKDDKSLKQLLISETYEVILKKEIQRVKEPEMTDSSKSIESSSSRSKTYSNRFELSSKSLHTSIVANIHGIDELIAMKLPQVSSSAQITHSGNSMTPRSQISSKATQLNPVPVIQPEPVTKLKPNVPNRIPITQTPTTKEISINPSLTHENTEKCSTYSKDKQVQTSVPLGAKSTRDQSTSPTTFTESVKITPPAKASREKQTGNHCCRCKCRPSIKLRSVNIPVIQIPCFPINPQNRDDWFANCMVQQLQLLRLQLEMQHHNYQMLCEWGPEI